MNTINVEGLKKLIIIDVNRLIITPYAYGRGEEHVDANEIHIQPIASNNNATFIPMHSKNVSELQIALKVRHENIDGMRSSLSKAKPVKALISPVALAE